MTRLSELLGSATRASIIETLASSKKPLTAYRISRMNNLNVPKVYLEVRRLARLDLVLAVKGRRGVEYSLIDENLRGLVAKLASRTISNSDWRSPEAKARRLRDGLMQVPKFSLGGRKEPTDAIMKATRLPGELDTLALLARKKFESKYRNVGDREYARV